MPWVWLSLGGITEIIWAYGLKASNGFTKPLISIVTIFFMIVSFYLFAKSLRSIPIGTGYTVFTGLGAAGTIMIGALVFNETMNVPTIFFLVLLIFGIIGIKSATKEEAKASEKE